MVWIKKIIDWEDLEAICGPKSSEINYVTRSKGWKVNSISKIKQKILEKVT